MLKWERQAFILHQINLHNRVLSTDLSVLINVSEDTIRRDLNELDEAEKLIKVHGGALSKSFHNSGLGAVVYQQDSKKIIAQKAVSLIKDGMSLLTTGGTSIIEMARLLPDDLHVTFFTVSIAAAYEYAQHSNIEVIFIGNKISKSSQITVGAETINKISQINSDLCFLGVNAINEEGISDNDWDVVQVKKTMIQSSKQTAFLTISEKLNTQQRIKVCELNKVGILITELDENEEVLKPYRRKDILVL
jgi:DeoR/GlpR family transcriptional regulator of sugar metabolism